MSKEKQIEEMVSIINSSDPHYECNGTPCRDCEFFFVQKNCYAAKALYNAGYRKQSEGEWVSNHQTDEYICSLCGEIAPVDCEKDRFYKSNFCPNCGAKMRKENN